jgi:hypothetical protein
MIYETPATSSVKLKALPSQERLLERLSYNSKTGELIWLNCPNMSKKWNTRWAGKSAFTFINTHGYFQGNFDSEVYRAHRIIWKMVYGTEPEMIDHINGVRSDNRLINLRSVNQSINMRNQKLRVDNTSGAIGVYKPAHSKKWVAFVRINGRMRYIGRFAEFADAVAARKSVEITNQYHENHGRICYV